MPAPGGLTERQEKWFAAVREGLERDTGKSVEAWAELARACPETKHRARLAWMKAQYGLGQNHASLVLNAAFPAASSWDKPAQLADKLWADAAARAVFDKVAAAAEALPDVVVGPRRGFTAFSRKMQFAAVRPAKAGAMLGLALGPDHDARLSAAGRESWSERLKSCVTLARPADVDAGIKRLLKAAWERS